MFYSLFCVLFYTSGLSQWNILFYLFMYTYFFTTAFLVTVLLTSVEELHQNIFIINFLSLSSRLSLLILKSRSIFLYSSPLFFLLPHIISTLYTSLSLPHDPHIPLVRWLSKNGSASCYTDWWSLWTVVSCHSPH